MTENTKATSAEKESSCSWGWGSGLPYDLARCIGERLDVTGRICFRGVCRSWRAALPAGRVSSMPSPWVVIPDADFLTLSSIHVNSAAPCSGSSFRLQMTCNSGLRCVGTSGGWLALAVGKSTPIALALHNPLTQQVVPLPPLPLPRRTGVRSWFAVTGILDHTIHKLAFSVSTRHGYTAAVLHRSTWQRGKGLELSFTRAGWDCWRWAEMMANIAGDDWQFDLACHVNDDGDDLYYVMTPCGWVWLLDKKRLAPLISIREPATHRELSMGRTYMVLPDDGTPYLVVLRMQTTRIRLIVQRYDPAGCPSSPWKPVTDLAGRSFLIASHSQSLSVSPTSSSPSWLRPDCVYLMTPFIPPVWCFHVATNTIGGLLQGSHRYADWGDSIWFTPSFR